jgi:hypothetical protein
MSKAPFPATAIRFEAVLKVENEWQVVANFPTGQKQHIAGFTSEAEAVTWIGSPRCLAWIKGAGLRMTTPWGANERPPTELTLFLGRLWWLKPWRRKPLIYVRSGF